MAKACVGATSFMAAPKGMAGAQAFGPSSIAFPGTVAGCWAESGTAKP